MTASDKDLSQRMRQRADADGLPAGHALRTQADALDQARAGYLAPQPTHNVKQFVGAWARARRAWCDYSGEPLI